MKTIPPVINNSLENAVVHPLQASGVATAMRKTAIVGTLAATLFLAGCAGSLRDLPKHAEITVPNNFAVNEIAPDSESIALNDAVVDGWVSTFSDAQFEKYAQRALDNNPDLRASAAQLSAAIKQVTNTGRSIWPSLSIGASKNASDVGPDGAQTTLRIASAGARH